MPTYKNLSNAVKTFYGVTFLPGDVKSVPGYINNLKFIRVEEPKDTIKTVVDVSKKSDITIPFSTVSTEEKSKPTRKYKKKSNKED